MTSSSDYLERLRAQAKRRGGRPPVSMAEMAALLQKSRVFRSANRLERFQAAWKAAATKVLGAEVANITKVESHAKGELKVTVASQALAREISTFHTSALVSEINESLDNKDRVARIKTKFGLV